MEFLSLTTISRLVNVSRDQIVNDIYPHSPQISTATLTRFLPTTFGNPRVSRGYIRWHRLSCNAKGPTCLAQFISPTDLTLVLSLLWIAGILVGYILHAPSGFCGEATKRYLYRSTTTVALQLDLFNAATSARRCHSRRSVRGSMIVYVAKHLICI